MSICTEPMLEMCPYGTYVLLGSLKHVLRGCNTVESALKELKVNDEYVQRCYMNGYDVLVLCQSRWLCLYTVNAVNSWCQVFGVLKELRFG